MRKEEKTVSADSTGDSGTKVDLQSDKFRERQIQQAALRHRMSRIKNKIIVLSGKGGVGKSTIAVNLALALSQAGKKVGLLDVDIHGPSVPKLLSLEGKPTAFRGGAIVPINFEQLKVMSIGFLLRERGDAVIWRGPMKMGVIEQFLRDVEWGELDYLVIDCPPGTGDEPLSVAQLIEGITGAVIVTTPQQLALLDVRKSINFCRQVGVPVLGVVENMSGFVCPKCGEVSEIFKSGGGFKLASEMGVPFLGRIPIDPQVVEAGDSGRPFISSYPESETAKAFNEVMQPVLGRDSKIKTKSDGVTA